MFKKILIANRGEIACRVIKTARRMNIATVAVFSDADRNALHVEMADEAVHIGAASAAESYLVADKIIAACQATGAQAVHPGYGFLSERASFCEALEAAGIAFIGPKKRAIEAMGDKITSKKLASKAGVSTVPGYMGLIDDADHAVKIATDIGYPVMIKASAGGGGKGMRIAWNDDEAREGFERSKSEAASSFGDDRIFIEKFVTEPRHIEIQVLADSKGNAIYLGERECSIQRRNQKVIEEAPSPFLDHATRQAMGAQSVALAKAVDYQSAGTVEFIVDKDRNFYFLEMNTRLQVEHPVTELITGVDLVEQMIRVAYGETLAIDQADVSLKGWAMESRLYAEDPYRNFLPSIGRLTRYRPPTEGEADDGTIVRNDTGVFEGAEISMFYDPMIAKLCTWGQDRETAIAKMSEALDGFEVEGIGHNLPFLSAVMDHPRFQSGQITTAFIEEEYPEGFEGVTPGGELHRTMAIAAAIGHLKKQTQMASLANHRQGSTAPGPDEMSRELVVAIDDTQTELVIHDDSGDYTSIAVSIDDQQHLVYCDWTPDQHLMRLVIAESDPPQDETSLEDDANHPASMPTFKIDLHGAAIRVRGRGADILARVYSPRVAQLAKLMPEKVAPDTSKSLLCPMPGLVVSLAVEVGQKVKAGETLAVVEAMKMENVLRAERDQTVQKINVAAGDNLAVDTVMMEFE